MTVLELKNKLLEFDAELEVMAFDGEYILSVSNAELCPPSMYLPTRVEIILQSPSDG